MTRTGKLTKVLATISVAGLGLTACSSDDEQSDGSSQEHQLDTLLATDASPDQRAAGAGASMAVELGFEQVQPATEEALGAGRDSA
ncbi:MAG: hypothetical protein L0K63_12085 [Yaniella sp.]|nr:hypothetical protein [Yaniella sp.]